MTVSSQKPAEDVELCYKAQAYLYDGTLWACTIPGENGNNKSFISNRYLQRENNGNSQNDNNAQCTNSSVKLLSELPCFSSTYSSTISTSSNNQLSSSSNIIGQVTNGTLSTSQLTTLGVVTTSTVRTSSSISSSTSISTVKPTKSDTLNISEGISSASTMKVTSTTSVTPATYDSSSGILLITSFTSNSLSSSESMSDKDAIGDTSRSSVTLVPSTKFVLPCPRDGPWIQTLAGTNATTARGCFKGTVYGKLYNKNVI